MVLHHQKCFITPHVSDGCNSFDIVCQHGQGVAQVLTQEMSSSLHDAARGEEVIYTPYMNGRAMTRGVFKAFVFSLKIELVSKLHFVLKYEKRIWDLMFQ